MKGTLFIICLTINCLPLLAQSYRYEGINNDPSEDRDFEQGSDKITSSIKEKLDHLNLYEYAHALPELYYLIDAREISIESWRQFVDSLENEVAVHQNDTIRPYWAVNYLGLIPLQSQFFLASIEKSVKLKEKYPVTYRLLKENTSSMEGLGYEEDDFDSLVNIPIDRGVKGTNTFWYFLQLEDCHLENTLVIGESPQWKSYLEDPYPISKNISATYKVPYYLQKRKWQSIQRRLLSSDNSLCKRLSTRMNKRSIGIYDDDREYFIRATEDGMDRDKSKEF